MAVYYGVVKDGAVLLPEDAHLPDGLEVAVSIATPGTPENGSLPVAEQVKQDLLRAGVISRIARPQPYAPDEDRTPIVIFGEPLSEQIIRERR